MARTQKISLTEQLRGIDPTSISVDDLNIHQNTNSEPTIEDRIAASKKRYNQYMTNQDLYRGLYGKTNYTHPIHEFGLPSDYGNSRFDKELNDYTQLSYLNDYRAERQGFLGEVSAALGSFVTTTLGTFANTIALPIGLLFGTKNAVFEFSSDKRQDRSFMRTLGAVAGDLINNPISNFINNIQEGINSKAFTFYKTQEEIDMPWYQQLARHPWTLFGADILPSLGFTAGAMYGGKANQSIRSSLSRNVFTKRSMEGKIIRDMQKMGIVLADGDKRSLNEIFQAVKQDKKLAENLINDLEKRIKKNNGWSTALGLMTGAFGEAQIEGINAANELYDDQLEALDAAWQKPALQNKLKSDYEELVRQSIINNTSGSIPSFEDYKKAEYDRLVNNIVSAANQTAMLTGLLQFGLLSVTNATAWKSFFHPSLNPAESFTNSVRSFLKPSISKNLETGTTQITGMGVRNLTFGDKLGIIGKKALVEGPVEEMGQAWISETAKYGYGSGVFDNYKYLVDSKYINETIKPLDAIIKGFLESYGNPDRWLEGFSGSLFGVIGVPDLSIRHRSQRAQTKNGGRKLFGKNGLIQYNGMSNAFSDIKTEKQAHSIAEDLAKKFQTPEEGLDLATIYKKVYEYIADSTINSDKDDIENKKSSGNSSPLTDAETAYLMTGNRPLELLRNVTIMNALSKKLDEANSQSIENKENFLLHILQPIFDVYKSIGCDNMLDEFLQYLESADKVDLSDDTNPNTQFFKNVFQDEMFTKLKDPDTGNTIVNNLSESQQKDLLSGIAKNAKTVRNYFDKYSKLRDSFTQAIQFRYPNLVDVQYLASNAAGFLAEAEMLQDKVSDSYQKTKDILLNTEGIKELYTNMESLYKKFLTYQNFDGYFAKRNLAYQKYERAAEELCKKLMDSLENGGLDFSNEEAETVVRDMALQNKVYTMKGELLAILNKDNLDDIYDYFYDKSEAILSETQKSSAIEVQKKVSDKLIELDKTNASTWEKVKAIMPLIDDYFKITDIDGIYDWIDKTMELDNNGRMRIITGVDFALVTALMDFKDMYDWVGSLGRQLRKTSDKSPAKKAEIQKLLNRLEEAGYDGYQEFMNTIYSEYSDLKQRKQIGDTLSENELAKLEILDKEYYIKKVSERLVDLDKKYTGFLDDAVQTGEGTFKYSRIYDYKKYDVNPEIEYTQVKDTNVLNDDKLIAFPEDSSSDTTVEPKGTIKSLDDLENTAIEIAKSVYDDAIEFKVEREKKGGFYFLNVYKLIEVDEGVAKGHCFIVGIDESHDLGSLCVSCEDPESKPIMIQDYNSNNPSIRGNNPKKVYSQFQQKFFTTTKSSNNNNNNNNSKITNVTIDGIQYTLHSYVLDLIEKLNNSDKSFEQDEAYQSLFKALCEISGIDPSDFATDPNLAYIGIVKENGEYKINIPKQLTPAILRSYPIKFKEGDTVKILYNSKTYLLEVTKVGKLGQIIDAVGKDTTAIRYKDGWFSEGKESSPVSKDIADSRTKFGNCPFTYYDYSTTSGTSVIKFREASTTSLENSEKYSKNKEVADDMRNQMMNPYNKEKGSPCAYSAVVHGTVKVGSALTFKLQKAGTYVSADNIKAFYGKDYTFCKNNDGKEDHPSYLAIFAGEHLVGFVDPSNTELLDQFEETFKKAKSKETVKLSGKVDNIHTSQSQVLTDPNNRTPINKYDNDGLLYVFVDKNNNIYSSDPNVRTKEKLSEKLNIHSSRIDDVLNNIRGKIVVFAKSVKQVGDDTNKAVESTYTGYGVEVTQKNFSELYTELQGTLTDEKFNNLWFIKELHEIAKVLEKACNNEVSKSELNEIANRFKSLFYTGNGYEFKLLYDYKKSVDSDNITGSTTNDSTEFSSMDELLRLSVVYQNTQDTNPKTVKLVDDSGNTELAEIDLSTQSDIFQAIVGLALKVKPLLGYVGADPFKPDEGGKSYFDRMKEINGLETTLVLPFEHNIYFTYDDGIKRESSNVKSAEPNKLNSTDNKTSASDHKVGDIVFNDFGTVRYYVKDLNQETINEAKTFVGSRIKDEWFEVKAAKTRNGEVYIPLGIIDINSGDEKWFTIQKGKGIIDEDYRKIESDGDKEPNKKVTVNKLSNAIKEALQSFGLDNSKASSNSEKNDIDEIINKIAAVIAVFPEVVKAVRNILGHSDTAGFSEQDQEKMMSFADDPIFEEAISNDATSDNSTIDSKNITKPLSEKEVLSQSPEDMSNKIFKIFEEQLGLTKDELKNNGFDVESFNREIKRNQLPMIINQCLKNKSMTLDFLQNLIWGEDTSTAETNPCD